MKKTLVIGASPNGFRYSNRAVRQLSQLSHEVVAFGKEEGLIGDVPITTQWPDTTADIHTATMYISPKFQKEFYEKLMALRPKRIIFNPGTENVELKKLADKNGIQTLNACTLVMLSIGDY